MQEQDEVACMPPCRRLRVPRHRAVQVPFRQGSPLRRKGVNALSEYMFHYREEQCRKVFHHRRPTCPIAASVRIASPVINKHVFCPISRSKSLSAAASAANIKQENAAALSTASKTMIPAAVQASETRQRALFQADPPLRHISTHVNIGRPPPLFRQYCQVISPQRRTHTDIIKAKV